MHQINSLSNKVKELKCMSVFVHDLDSINIQVDIMIEVKERFRMKYTFIDDDQRLVEQVILDLSQSKSHFQTQ